MPVKFECPRCHAGISAPETAAGKQGKCPKCRATLRVPHAQPTASAAQGEKIRFSCPTCSQSLAVVSEWAGRRAKCPHCQATIPIPDPEAELGAELIPLPDEPDELSLFDDSASEPFGDSGGGYTLSPRETSPNPYAAGSGGQYVKPFNTPRAVSRESCSSAARRTVVPPALCMITVAALSIVFLVCHNALRILADGLQLPDDPDPSIAAGRKVGYVVGMVLPITIQLIVIAGAVKMLKLRSYGAAMTAAICATLPCSAMCILNTPFGIWSLIALNSQNVKRAFQ